MPDGSIKQIIDTYSNRDLEQRKHWYSSVAEAYNTTRPLYPDQLISQVREITQLPLGSKILEIGSGTANATRSFAQLGFSMTCLEPNPDFCQLAQANSHSYDNIKIHNLSFEEWQSPEKFDAILAASSWHWIPSEVAYPKAIRLLQDQGYLILLWNKELQPQYKIHQSLAAIYELYAPHLYRYETKETQIEILNQLGKMVTNSGLFGGLRSGQVESEVAYTVDHYLMLLSTYSPYLKLAAKTREALFEDLRGFIQQEWGDSLKLSYISAFHIARKF